MRRNKVIGSNYGLLYRDVAFLPREVYKGKMDSPTICIEIKAKQGYIIDDDSNDEVKKCRFCYLQVGSEKFSNLVEFSLSVELSYEREEGAITLHEKQIIYLKI
jgi:hypothetical protein